MDEVTLPDKLVDSAAHTRTLSSRNLCYPCPMLLLLLFFNGQIRVRNDHFVLTPSS